MRWRVFERYGADNHWVIADDESGVKREYDPLADEDGVGAVIDFGRLRDGDQTGLLRFVSTWGLLDAVDQEPMDWLWGHVRNVRIILRAYKALQENDPQSLNGLLNAHRAERGRVALTFAVSLWEEHPAVGAGALGWGWVALDWDDPVNVAKRLVARILMANLGSLKLEIDPESLHLQPQLSVTSLRSAMYWHLARLVSGEQRIQVCQECGALFPLRDAREKFCPPPPGAKGSLCGDRYRKRRKRRLAT